MSVEQANAFIEKMKTDEVFREQIMAIEIPEERLRAIEEAGFECTAEEINDACAFVGEVSGGCLLVDAIKLPSGSERIQRGYQVANSETQ